MRRIPDNIKLFAVGKGNINILIEWGKKKFHGRKNDNF